MARLNFSVRNEKKSAGKDLNWKILIVDDEISVHQMTKIIMENWSFMGRPVTLVNAYSEKEAREVLAREDDLALVFMDVIMEREDSGFRLVEYIRNELGNKFTRIVLRTGQPGTLSIREIVQKYDINDYREKIQLSVDVLYTITSSCLRSYSDLRKMEFQNNCLKAFFETYPYLVDSKSVSEAGVRALGAVRRMFGMEGECGIIRCLDSMEGEAPRYDVPVWISENDISTDMGFARLTRDIRSEAEKCFVIQEGKKTDKGEYCFYRSSLPVRILIFIGVEDELAPEMKTVLDVYMSNIISLLSRTS